MESKSHGLAYIPDCHILRASHAQPLDYIKIEYPKQLPNKSRITRIRDIGSKLTLSEKNADTQKKHTNR